MKKKEERLCCQNPTRLNRHTVTVCSFSDMLYIIVAVMHLLLFVNCHEAKGEREENNFNVFEALLSMQDFLEMS